MRTLLSFSFPLVLAGACADDPTLPPTDFVVPSARTTNVDGFDFAEMLGATTSCMTRYNIAGLPPGVECRTALVGDARHWITTCPAVHSQLPTTREIELDADDRLVRDVAIYPDVPGVASRPGRHATTYHYDAEGRLAAMETESDRPGIPGRAVTFGDLDPAGNAHSAEVTNEPFVFDQPYPSTARSQWSLTYDAKDRLIGFQARFAPSGNLHFDESVAYDDHARRRVISFKSDLSAEIPTIPPTQGPPAKLYDLFDREGRIIERRTVGSVARNNSAQLFRYDEEGRMLTTAFTSTSYSYTAREIYDCP
jgi:hypothetical protein